jgi:sulfur transfer protein SufE
MVQVNEMSHQEKVEMYRLVDKERLIEMLIESNKQLHKFTNTLVTNVDTCNGCWSQVSFINNRYICCTCNKPINP